MYGIIGLFFFIMIFVYLGRIEGRIKHVQDALARLENKKEKK